MLLKCTRPEQVLPMHTNTHKHTQAYMYTYIYAYMYSFKYPQMTSSTVTAVCMDVN